MNLIRKTLLTAALAAAAVPALAADEFTLDFEGLGSGAQILDFYNGGTDSAGNSGVNRGVGFGANALALKEDDPSANFSLEPSPNTVMFFLTGSAVLNYAPGFDTAFSFYFSTVSFTGVVNVYDGLNATGNLLGSIVLPALGAGPDPANPFSNWQVGKLTFDGIAKSIDFGGTVNQVGYDDITFGAVIPEPSTHLLLALGLAGVGVAARRIRARA